MFDVKTEESIIKVPVNSGLLIGNTLRQYAIRGVATWQVVAYNVNGKEGSFGLSGGYHFDQFKFFPGRLIAAGKDTSTTEKICRFEYKDPDYICSDMVITGLGGLQIPYFDACLVYASGARTSEENYAVVKKLAPQDVMDFIVVPSRHNPTIHFAFKVEPYNRNEETLIITATPGVAKMALQSAMSSLSGLHIDSSN